MSRCTSIRPARACQRAASLLLVIGTASAQVSTYDASTGTLVIPAVQVGTEVYTDVRLFNQGSFQFALQTATQQLPPGRSVGSYDPASGMLVLPAVQVGSETYVDVTLKNLGSFQFALQTATLVPPSTLDAITAFLRQQDALWATAVPPTGSLRATYLDGCYLEDGRDRAYRIAETDSDPATIQARDAYRIGQSIRNIQLRALRTSTAADGQARIEADVQYDVAYRDGSSLLAATNTLIAGSSAGIPGCTTPQTGDNGRILADQQVVQTAVRARNTRDERYQISNGNPASTPLNYRRDVQFVVTDPLDKATYVIVSGPGPAGSVGGASVPFSLKLLSPRILRSAPELAGKSGNFLDWRDDDGFRFCRIAGSGIPVAEIADCTGQGVGSNDLGVTSAAAGAAADASFDAMGFVAGALYTFSVYADDGWKTVGGHVGRTPIAVYTDVLEVLPYRFVDMVGAGSDRFPRMSFLGRTMPQVRANLVAASPSPMNVSWTALGALPDAAVFRLFEAWEFFQGASVGNTGGAFFPAYRTLAESYPDSQASSVPAWAVTAKPATMSSKSFAEFTLQFVDRNDRQILSKVSFN